MGAHGAPKERVQGLGSHGAPVPHGVSFLEAQDGWISLEVGVCTFCEVCASFLDKTLVIQANPNLHTWVRSADHHLAVTVWIQGLGFRVQSVPCIQHALGLRCGGGGVCRLALLTSPAPASWSSPRPTCSSMCKATSRQAWRRLCSALTMPGGVKLVMCSACAPIKAASSDVAHHTSGHRVFSLVVCITAACKLPMISAAGEQWVG